MNDNGETLSAFVKLSKNYKSRSDDETKCLYSYIQSLTDEAKSLDDKISKEAINDLIILFTPIILKFSSIFYQKVKDQYEYDDVLQEGYCLFILCIHNYDKNLSMFLYYIKSTYPFCFSTWVKTIKKQSDHLSDTPFTDMVHPHLDDDDKIFNNFMENLYAREYVNFIKKLSLKYSKTDTHRIVCEKYFLGNNTCLELASELNVSYHAIYDCIRKIKRDLNYFIKNNKDFYFYFGSDSEVILKKEEYEK